MKPQLTLTLALLLFCMSLSAQVKFKVKLLTDNVTYQVLLKPDATWNAPFNSVPSAQVTFVVPTGGFQVGSVTNLKGNWSNNTTIVAPPENPGFDYIVFGLQGATSAITFQKGVEVALFNFKNNGSCTGAMELIEHATDPFMPPNSQSVNVGNQISVIGAGIGVNAYTGNYNALSADCMPTSSCGIEVFDIILTSPTACGVADGKIEIVATNSNGLPLQYSVNNGISFQSSSIITNLPAGDLYEIIVRDIAAICIVDMGDFELDGPLAAVVTGVELVDPDCGGSNGSIKIIAFSEIGNPLEYGIGVPTTWQTSNTFTGLPAGTYPTFVRDVIKNCESPAGSHTLLDCPPDQCLITYALEDLGGGRYQVNMIPGVDYNFPNNITSSAQVTIKVPTDGFEVSNLTMQTPNVNFDISSTYIAPSEDPGYDYISFGLTSFGTQNIPYSSGDTVHFFTFENAGICNGDSIWLMKDTDPFYPPNSQSANVGQQLTVSGYGGADMPICIGGTGAVACGNIAPPAPSCLITYELEELPNGSFQISMTADTTWTFPGNITSSAQWTVKVPTGGFAVSNLTSLVTNVNFDVASTYAAPTEDPAHDYISFILASPGTSAIPYQKGVKKPLFSFANSGACKGGSVFLMNNDTDPFFPPNSQSANVGQQLTVSGYGGADAPICILNNPADDCTACASSVTASADVTICEGKSTTLTATGSGIGTYAWSPVTGLSCTNCATTIASPGADITYSVTFTDTSGCISSDQVVITIKPAASASFLAQDGCEGNPVDFNNTTTSIGTISSWNWDFGDGSNPSSLESPSHTYSTSGNFEVSLTVTTGDGCTSNFSEFVTVFPSPGQAPVDNFAICQGGSVQLQSPGSVSAVWTPATGLSDANSPTPVANPSASTTYSVTYTNVSGCTTIDQVTVFVSTPPVFVEVNVSNQTDCGVNDGTIEIIATGSGALQYSANNGTTWQNNKTITGLSAGTYTVLVRNSNGTCPTAFSFNPVEIEAPLSPSITSVVPSQPNGCNSDGGIAIIATGGAAPLQYSINGGTTFQSSHIFQNLPGGTYQVVVANSDESCKISPAGGDVVLNQATPPTVVTPVADFSLCQGSSATVSIQISTNIQSYTISGTGTYSSDSANGNTLAFDVTPSSGTVNYSVVLTGTNGCTVTEGFQLQQLSLPVATFTNSTPLCANGLVTLNFTGTATPSSTLNWNLDGGQVQFSSAPTATAPAGATTVVKWASSGTKNISLTVDQAGCQDNETGVINITTFNPGATFTVTDVSTCGGNNGAINLALSGSGAWSFNWNGPGIAGSTQQNHANLAGGAYQVTITETNSGCSATASTTVNTPQPVSIVSLVDDPASDCSGSATNGSLTVQVSGGLAPFQYLLFKTDNLATPVSSQNSSQTSLTFTGLSAGAYQVEVVTAAGCKAVQVTTVTASGGNFVIADSSVQPSSCGGSDGAVSVVLQGGTAPYTYDLYQNNTLLFDDQAVTGSTLSLGSLAPDTYVIIFSDNIGCVVPSLITIGSQSAAFTITANETKPSCNSSNGSIELSGFPAGATFNWQGTNGGTLPATSSQTGLPVGIYNVTITDVSGCSSTKTYVLEPNNGPQVTINNTLNATCGQANGGVFFTVAGNNSFSYKLLNSTVDNFGMPGTQIAITGIFSGAFVLEVVDLVTQCTIYAPVTLQGTTPPQLLAIATPPSACNVQDAAICIQISGGVAPYSITSTLGTAPGQPVSGIGCIQGLYEGTVDVTVTDAAGCDQSFSITLPDQPDVTVTASDVTITNFTCPGEFGSIISNTGTQYNILNENNFLIGVTPLTQVPSGNYKVSYTLGGCTATLPVAVNGPADWNISTGAQAEGCSGNDGAISLTVNGGNGGYTYLWSTGATTLTANSLTSTASYSVTITDSSGCFTTLSNLTVALDCINPCQAVFLVDTFKVALQGDLTEICLPTNQPDISIFDLYLDGSDYNSNIGDCVDSTIFYGYGMLFNLGQPPYRLDQWTYRGNQSPDFTFNTVSHLVAHMNSLDPTGNWAENTGQSSISGGAPNSTYGSLVITHVASNTTLNLQVNTLSVAHPSIFVNDNPFHIFIVEDANGCKDTLFINVLDGIQPSQDTIFVEVPVGGSDTICVSADQLFGNPEFLTNNCISFTNNAQIISDGTMCIEVLGISEGPDQACMVLCDDNGICDTTIIVIKVIDASRELIIYTGFSPNEDGYNDYFRIKNIELYPNNTLMVFNRWGNKVFETTGYSNANPWKGHYNSNTLPDATYFYLLDVEIDGKKEKFSGYVEIRR